MRLKKYHRTAIELMIKGELTMDEIAKSVKKSRQALYKWLEDEDFKAEYDERIAEIERRQRRRICNMAEKALDRQEQILKKSKNDMAAASVAADVLDRAGYTKENVVTVGGGAAPVQIINDIPRGGEADEQT